MLSLLGCPLAEMQLSLEGEGLEGEEEDEEEEVGPGSENIRKLAEDIMVSTSVCFSLQEKWFAHFLIL